MTDNDGIINPIAEPGIDAENAYQLGQLEQNLTIQEALGSNEVADFYEFTVGQAGEFSFDLTNLAANADLILTDASGNEIEISKLAGTQTEIISADLAAGNYYLGVISADGADTTYSLNIDVSNVDGIITPLVEPGLDSTNAYQIGQIEQNLTVRETVGGDDEADVYQFTVGQAGEFSFDLTNLAADADLILTDTIGNEIEIAKTAGTQTETISADLAAGNYYLGVISADGVETTYNLNVDVEAVDGVVNPLTEPGIDAANAYQLGQLEQNLTVRESVGGNDITDVYQFTVGQAGEFSFDLTNLAADAELILADLTLTDASGNQIEITNISGTQAETISADLAAGTYNLQVVSASSVETTYNLNIDVGDVDGVVDPLKEPGIDVTGAYKLGQIEQNLVVREVVGVDSDDLADFYQFTVAQAEEFSFELTNLSADVNLILTDAQGEIFDSSVLGGTQAETISVDLAAGIYNLGVVSADGMETTYNLHLETSSLDTPLGVSEADSITTSIVEEFSLV